MGSRAVAVTITASDGAIEGSYVYEGIGKDLALAGAAQPDGEILLGETFAAKPTGSFRLRVTSSGLSGTWSAPSGARSMPVELRTPVPWAETLTGRAETCLADPVCPAQEAERLFLAADDAHAETASCDRFIDGAGVKRDLVRARACLERVVAREGPCKPRENAGIDKAELAVMRIDGAGAPQDLPGARALLEPCFDDVTKIDALEYASRKESDPRTPRADFCKDIGGTTQVYERCTSRALEMEKTKAELSAKGIAEQLDAEGKQLVAAAGAAHEAYVDAQGRFVYQVYIEGSARGVIAMGEEQKLTAARAKALARFRTFTASDVKPDAAARSDRIVAVADALAKRSTSTTDERAALQKAQEAWLAYRDAEVALYVAAFGPTQGADRVRGTLLLQLAERRAREWAPPSLGR